MRTLLPYQQADVQAMDDFGGRVLLANEAGTGKTFTSLSWLRDLPEAFPALIVCPASLKLMWAREAAETYMRAEIGNGMKPPRKGLLPPRLLIVNYDILDGWKDYLVSLNLQTVIFDECQSVRTPSARRSKAAKYISHQIPYRIGLSGTPLTSRASELWHILSIIRPDLYPSFERYAEMYCPPKMRPWGLDYSTSRHMGKLHHTLKRQMMIRRLKSDVLADLPPKMHCVVPVPLSNRREYERAETDFLNWIAVRHGPRAAIAANRAEKLMQMGHVKRLAAQLKLPSVLEWIDNFLSGTDGKLVVFAVHRTIVDAITEKYKSISVKVNGDVTGINRDRAVRQFQTDPKCRLFVGNIQAAGTGLTLTAATTVVFAELPWLPAELSQASDRIHRIGQMFTAMIYYLVAENTIEEKLCKILQAKQVVLSAVLDGKGADDLDLNICDLLMEELYA